MYSFLVNTDRQHHGLSPASCTTSTSTLHTSPTFVNNTPLFPAMPEGAVVPPKSLTAGPSNCSVQLHKPPVKRLWLDILPSELRVRIALHVSGARQTENALRLAEVNPIQRAAVLFTLSHKLILSDSTLASRWASLFASDVRQVTFDRYFSFKSADTPHFNQLLRAPNLFRADIRGHPAELLAIAGSKSVRELAVTLRKDVDLELLLVTLSSLTVKKLQLICTTERRYCPVKKLVQRNSRHDALSIACPELQSLRLACFHRDPLWTLLPTFPKLREVMLETRVQVAALPSLSTLDSVHIIGAQAPLYVAEKLGTVVKSLATKQCLLKSDVEMLGRRCPKMSDLRVGIHEDASVALIDALSNMSSLKSLKMRWGVPAAPAARGYKWNIASFCSVQPGILLRALDNLPDLVELELLCVRIDIAELTAILRKLGKRLQRFSTSIADQDEGPFQRLDRIVRAVTRYNPSLHNLSIDMQRTDQMTLLGIMQHENREQRVRQGRMLVAALKELSRTAPALRTEEISAWMMWYFL